MTAPLPSLHNMSLRQSETGMEASSSTNIVRIPRAGRPMTDAEYRARRKRAQHLVGLMGNMEPYYLDKFLQWAKKKELEKVLPEITTREGVFLVIELTRLTDAEFKILDQKVVEYHARSQILTDKIWAKVSDARKIEMTQIEKAKVMKMIEDNQRRRSELQGVDYKGPEFFRENPELQGWGEDDVDMDSESSDS